MTDRRDEQAAQVMDELRQELAAVRAERDHYRSALEHLGTPNWRIRATGEDARRMAAYARNAVLEMDEMPESVPDP